jgi:septum site-determining protein MinD
MSKAKFIVFFSTKGGVGKTLLCMNSALALQKESRANMCVVDFDLQAPMDMARLLNLTPAKSISDIAASSAKSPAWKIEEFTTQYSPGLEFLTACLNPHHACRINEKTIIEALGSLENKYDYVLIDAGRAFTDSLISVLSFANLVLLVVTPDILSIYQTKWALDVLQSLHFPLKMVKFVLNRSESLGAYSWQDVKMNLPADILAMIPSDGRTVGLAVNRRVPVITDSPKGRFTLAINKLVHEILSRKDELFLERVTLDAIHLAKEAQAVAGSQDFWQRYGITETQSIEQEEKIDELVELKRRVHKRIIEELDLKRLDVNVTDQAKYTALRKKTEKAIANALAEESGALLSSFEVRKRLTKEIADEALVLGPLEDLINDVEVSEILVNNKDQIYIERHGKLELTAKRFISNDQLRQIIERIITPLGRRIDESSPMVDARLPDGSRVNAIIPPLSLGGPMLTIRKFGKENLTIEALKENGTLNVPMAEFLRACVMGRKNIIVSGGTGSGKTTVLNTLSTYIPANERIITIEDAAELKLSQEHWARLESRTANIEGKGAVTIRDLFRNTLRMRPDRIIIGECRGAETLDMLQAMNTGHDGSMTTIHANSTKDVLSRLDSMILMSGIELPIRAIREMISSAIDIIVHTARLPDGSRKIMQITAVTGMADEIHVGMMDIFLFSQVGTDTKGKIEGNFMATGYIPFFIDEMRVRGIPIPDELFQNL